MKTIRYYSDLGILPPSAVRGSGYRLYAEGDRARLALVRALRDLGIDLASIARLLEARASVADTLALQLDAVELRLRTLQRQRAVLRAAVARGAGDVAGDASLAYLDRLRAFARLDAAERQRLVDRWLDRAFDGVPVDAAWAARFRELARVDLPDAPTDAQLDAWLELAELVTDDDFAARMRAVGEEAWGGRAAMDDARQAELRAVEADALRLADAGAAVSGAEARAVVERYVALHGSPARELLARFDRAADPRAARYWELLAIIRGWPPAGETPQVRTYRWLHAALRAAVAV